MDNNKAVQRIETNLARDDGVNIHTRDIEIQDKDVEVGPLGFTGLSPTLTINGVFPQSYSSCYSILQGTCYLKTSRK